MRFRPVFTALFSLSCLASLGSLSTPALAQFHGHHGRHGHHGGHGGHGGHEWHGGVRFGVYVGAPALWSLYPPPYYAPSYYVPPYYAPTVVYPPVVVNPAPVYIQRQEAAPSPAPASSAGDWWYYCAESKSYYPYVQQCPGGWQRVSPRPAG